MWTQDDNYGLYAYVAISSADATKIDTAGQTFGTPEACHFVADGYANTTNSTVVVNGATVPMTVSNTPLATRRQAFATLLAASHAFARGTAHRIYAEDMDPLLDSNQILAGNLKGMAQPAVLTTLTQQFQAGGFSLKSYLRVILNSALYQLTTAGTTTANDALLARRRVRRHHAEVVEQGVYAVTGEPFPLSVARGGSGSNFFEELFGYPVDRSLLLERTDQVNISQTFLLMNSALATNGLAAMTNSRIETLANQVSSAILTLQAAVTTVFHDALGRDPFPAELAAIDSAEAGETPLTALTDVAIAVCSTSEYVAR
jgi:hypothetical protein